MNIYPLAAERRGKPAAPVIASADARADGGQHLVELYRDHVIIARRVAGIAMRFAVCARAYRGVALLLDSADAAQISYHVDLVHTDPDLNVRLFEANDDLDIAAEWRLWANYFALPALIEREAGQLTPCTARLGTPEIGAAPMRRKRWTLRSRKSCFAGRRKTGAAARLQEKFSGREIIARN